MRLKWNWCRAQEAHVITALPDRLECASFFSASSVATARSCSHPYRVQRSSLQQCTTKKTKMPDRQSSTYPCTNIETPPRWSGSEWGVMAAPSPHQSGPLVAVRRTIIIPREHVRDAGPNAPEGLQRCNSKPPVTRGWARLRSKSARGPSLLEGWLHDLMCRCRTPADQLPRYPYLWESGYLCWPLLLVALIVQLLQEALL